ncbi:hypothetical protein, variant [Aphanomyces invadans]|uniref:3-oxo-5-alpha-steroid 4-dehydrogenase C-terminal domain-containing protein n=1 Tax=Aphanomyces invadans TaxID=157072 RepID=A0A024U369_9STRA|nr:hypothetical protein, variant [Aphanomyces invadans]ETW00053.1 hypothetical protein, variant [Aphanomyces invadans]|eukprot:XP_008871078.1 hypothetical protein, variant [Aphanomyces invadans]
MFGCDAPLPCVPRMPLVSSHAGECVHHTIWQLDHACRRCASSYWPPLHLRYVALILGTGHYILVSLSIVLDNGAKTPLSLAWFDILLLLSGVGLFLVASAHQMKCNAILASLKAASPNPSYGVPKGDWFDLTWSPLYLCEVLLYVAFVLMTQGRNENVWWIALWVSTNQAISAHRGKGWYLDTFPAARTAQRATLIPYVW